jgi:hypothetical protein
MAQSSEIYNEIQSLLGQINPRLDALPDADTYYKNKVNEAYNYNMPAIQNASKLEGEMYSLPGNLMSEYDTEFGGKTGVSSNQRINSILSRLGNQGALASTAWGLVDQSGARIDELAKTLSNQYRTGIEADQAKLSPLMSIWDRMYSEEQANARAARSGGGGTVYVNPWGDIEWEDDEEKKVATDATTKTVSPSSKKMADSLKSGTFTQDYMGAPKPVPANTGSTQLDYYINKIKGITG